MKQDMVAVAKLAIVFTVVFSLAGLGGATASNIQFPSLHLARANRQPTCGLPTGTSFCPWYPAGPAMDTLQNTIFTDQFAEFTNIQSSSPSIDLTDWPLTPDLIAPLTASPSFYVSDPIRLNAYYDIQFMLANNFWGCDFNYGNSQCGIDIRQGIAHLIDRGKFAAAEPSLTGMATPIDNPAPNNSLILSPNPCNWDSANIQTGSNCDVGAPGGTAYHLANATGANGIPWLPGPGSPDLCAAANHFINAGIATGKTTNCVLTGVSSLVGSHVPNFFRSYNDVARLHIFDSLSQQICYLFSGSYTFPCQYVSITSGPFESFPGFTTSRSSVNLSWWVYIGVSYNTDPFNASLYTKYNSRSVSGISSIQLPTGPCSSAATPSFSAQNYEYLCNSNYDNNSIQMEFSPCQTAPGDPLPNTILPPSGGPLGYCLSDPTKLSAASAGYNTEDTFGKGAYSIPMFVVSAAQSGYLSNWQRIINDSGAGIPNYFTWLNAYSSNPAVPGIVRQGFSGSTSTLNPFAAESRLDIYMLHNIYDSLSAYNPNNPGQNLDWMTVNEQTLGLSALTYTPPAGTIQSFRFTLRSTCSSRTPGKSQPST